MQKNIHPKYYDEALVICACGNTFTTGSTVPEVHVEVCSKCHPFFTGKQKFVDTVGRIDRFKKRQERALKEDYLNKKVAKKKEVKEKEEPKTLKEMLLGLK